MSIFIFSRPVHSGKTTELLNWCKHTPNVYGVAMPDIDGNRKIIDLHSKEIFDIECTDTNTYEPLTVVGRFKFFTAAFDSANKIIRQALTQPADWLVIDEVGKLELDGKGFYRSMRDAVSAYHNNLLPGKLLLTVRENLCKDVIRYFDLNDCQIIHSMDRLGQ